MLPYLFSLSSEIAPSIPDDKGGVIALVAGLVAAGAPGVAIAIRAGSQAGAAAARLSAVEKELEKRATMERLESFTREVDSKLDAITKAVDSKASSESMRHVERSMDEIKQMVRELLNRERGRVQTPNTAE